MPDDFATSLQGSTTLARCWRLTRRDGAALGFTDHDRDLAFAGTVFAARSGLEAADAAAELGFAVGGGDVSGALTSEAIAEADVAAGLYDDAAVETWLVDWTDPDRRRLTAKGTIGEVRRADGAFVAEVRGLMHRLDERRGRVFAATCDADLGDARCGVDLSHSAWRTDGVVTATDGGHGVAGTGLDAHPAGRFSGGRLTWTGGANAGLAADVRVHRPGEVSLWSAPARPVAAGDAFALTAGCDKRFATCLATFANTDNFRGFPHMPGNDFILRGPSGHDPLDGGSLFA